MGTLTITALAQTVADSEARGAAADNNVVVLVKDVLLALDKPAMLEGAGVRSRDSREGGAGEDRGLRVHGQRQSK